MSTPVIQTVTPEQVASIETLKNKQLHIVADYHEGLIVTEILKEYRSIINQFLKDNNLRCYSITTTIYETSNIYNQLRRKEPNKILILIK